ncbi:hypothetical protein FHW79_005359 [Azospirillum sp. OGB3]|uniref:hypothetical protein n=1 Tax=Azospirillum sp. OGB3 TaxID=2587012 RepID=UPI0016064440|nr:hypothetical protein [Azospirillum sp. OGB3]MBB3267694.1 hypothetical protein [Azospirillum sp. OGB3]
MRYKVPGTALSWSTVAEWAALVLAVCGQSRHRKTEHERRAKLVWSLRISDIRACTDAAALDAAARIFGRSLRDDGGLSDGPFRCMTRAEIGERLVECRNQAHRVRSGVAFLHRPAGPRFDPAVMPLPALERLIQTHPDIAVVELLRAERRRRFDQPAQPCWMVA